MTDQATDTTTETQSQNTAADTPDAGGGEAQARAWYADLPEDIRSNQAVSRYATPEDAARALIHAQGKLRAAPESLVELPKPDDQKGWDALFQKLGRPETKEGYNLELPADASEEVKANAAALTEVAHKAGILPQQLAPLVGLLAKAGEDAQRAEQERRVAEAKACTDTLKAEWGDKFSLYSKEINTLVMDTVGKEGFDELNKTDFANNATLMRLLAKVSDMRAEPGKPAGEGGRADAGGALTPAQAKAELAKIQTDPEASKALMDANHAQHKFWVDRRLELLKFANPAPQA